MEGMKNAKEVFKDAEVNKFSQKQNAIEEELQNPHPLLIEDEFVDLGASKQVVQKKIILDSLNKLKSLFRAPDPGQKSSRDKSVLLILNDDLEKRSATYMQFRDAMAELETLLNDIDPEEELPVERISIAVLRLSECTNAYYDTHRGHRSTSKGKDTKKLVEEVRALTESFIEDLDVAQGGEDSMTKNARIDYKTLKNTTNEEAIAAVDHVKKLDKVYKGWAANIGSREGNERKRIYDKLALFKPYETDILRYQLYHKDRASWPYCVKEYDLYMRKYRIIKNLEKSLHENAGIETGNVLDRIIHDHAVKMDETEEEKTLSSTTVDKDLREDQVKGVEEIDRYLIRNFKNGGLMGMVANRMKNNHADIINELFRKTRRERLFIYYLIEKGERKNPSISSVYKSQGEYTPNLNAFKKQMLATKLKLFSRVTGGYIYMHKLSEAMAANKVYKEVVKDCSLVSAELEEEKNNFDLIPEDQVELNNAYEARKQQLKKTFRSLNSLHEAQIAYKRAVDNKKPNKNDLKTRVQNLNRIAKEDMQALTEADEAVGAALNVYRIAHPDQKNETRENTNRNDVVSNAGTYTKTIKSVSGYGGEIVNGTLNASDKVLSFFGHEPITSWRVKDSGLADAKIWGSAITGPAIVGVAQILSTLNAVYNLCSNGAKMHAGDIGESIVNILKNAGEFTVNVWDAVEKGKYFTENAENLLDAVKYAPSSALTITSAVTSSAGIAINGYKIIRSGLDHHNASNAREYLNAKHSAEALNDEELADLSEEERTKELKKRKEIKYEKSMTKLAKDLAKRNVTSGIISGVANTASLISVLIPGIGIIAASVGITISVIDAIVYSSQTSKARTALFDSYFELDNLYSKIKSKMEEKGRHIYDEEKYKSNLRNELCGAAGYADMGAAADHIAAKYADFIRARLFSDDPNEFESENEKNAYIQFVKSFGMTFNKEKDQPDRDRLKRIISGR